MIWLYSGTPGSGKSLDTASDIVNKLRRGQRVICNFPINMKIVRGAFRKVPDDLFVYKDNPDLTVRFLVDFAKQHHKQGKEGQTLLVIDECSVKFNSREWDKSDRMAWIKFLQHHRKYGYNVILIAQNDRLIDRQIRAFVEYEIKHRKANNFGTIGLLFTLFHIPLFAAVEYWYGVNEKCGVRFFTFNRRYAKLYDTFKIFEDVEDWDCKVTSTAEVIVGGARRKRGGPTVTPVVEVVQEPNEQSKDSA